MLMARNVVRAWLLPAILAVPLFATLPSATVGAAGEDVLALVPKDALGFAVINRLSDVSEKLGKVSRDLELPFPDLLILLKMKLGITEGLNEKGNMLLAMLPPREGEREPQPLVALPVLNYKNFLELFQGDAAADINQIEIAGQKILVASKGTYAILVNPENRAGLEQLIQVKATAPAEVGSFTEWIGENDAAVVFLNPGLKLVVQMAIQGLEEAKEKFAGLDLGDGKSAQATAAMDLYIQMLESVRDEVRTAAKGLRFDADGNFVFGTHVRFTGGGRLADLANFRGADKTNLLAGLPGGPYVGAFSIAWSSECSEAVAKWSVSMMQYNPALMGVKLSAEEAQEYAKASALSMEGLRRMSMLMTPGTENEKLLETFLGIFDVEDSQKYLANYEKAMQVWLRLMEKSESPVLMQMEATQVTIGGLQGLKISMDMESMMAAQGAPLETTRMLERMFGNGGKMSAHVLAVDKNTILMSYAPVAAIEKTITTYQKNKTHLADDPGVAKIAALLLSEPDMLACLSPRGTVSWFGRVMNAVMPAGVTAPELAEFPDTPPIGFSAKMVTGGMVAKWVVPAELPKAVKEFAQRARR